MFFLNDVYFLDHIWMVCYDLEEWFQKNIPGVALQVIHVSPNQYQFSLISISYRMLNSTVHLKGET